MKMKTAVTLAAAMMLSVGMAQAAHMWEDPNSWAESHFAYGRNPTPKYTAQELSLDLFGSYIAGQRNIEHLFETNIRHGKWGGGVGLNYFFTREIGLGGDINMSENGGLLVDQAAGNLIARLPLGESGVAPYIFGGGGRAFDPTWEWFGHGGVGLEFRFNPTTGIFIDGRYIWNDISSDKLLLRAGLRIVF